MSVVTESPLLCFLLHQSRTERLDRDLQATQWLPTAIHWPGHRRGEEMSTPPYLSCIRHGKLLCCTLFSDLCVRLCISLTMHLGIILSITNLTHFFFVYLFISLLYMFRATQCSSSGESNCINTSSSICHSV